MLRGEVNVSQYEEEEIRSEGDTPFYIFVPLAKLIGPYGGRPPSSQFFILDNILQNLPQECVNLEHIERRRRSTQKLANHLLSAGPTVCNGLVG